MLRHALQVPYCDGQEVWGVIVYQKWNVKNKEAGGILNMCIVTAVRNWWHFGLEAKGQSAQALARWA